MSRPYLFSTNGPANEEICTVSSGRFRVGTWARACDGWLDAGRRPPAFCLKRCADALKGFSTIGPRPEPRHLPAEKFPRRRESGRKLRLAYRATQTRLTRKNPPLRRFEGSFWADSMRVVEMKSDHEAGGRKGRVYTKDCPEKPRFQKVMIGKREVRQVEFRFNLDESTAVRCAGIMFESLG